MTICALKYECWIKRSYALMFSMLEERNLPAFETARPNYFEQHITDIKNMLIAELEFEEVQRQIAAGVDLDATEKATMTEELVEEISVQVENER